MPPTKDPQNHTFKSIQFIGRWSATILIAVVGVMASTAPESASTNIASWWKYIFESVSPMWMTYLYVDKSLQIFSIFAFLIIVKPWKYISSWWARDAEISNEEGSCKGQDPADAEILNQKSTTSSYMQSGGITAQVVNIKMGVDHD